MGRSWLRIAVLTQHRLQVPTVHDQYPVQAPTVTASHSSLGVGVATGAINGVTITRAPADSSTTSALGQLAVAVVEQKAKLSALIRVLRAVTDDTPAVCRPRGKTEHRLRLHQQGRLG